MRRLGGLLTAPAVAGLGLEDAWHYADDDSPGWTWRRENPYLAAGTRSCRIDYILAGQATRILRSGLLGRRHGGDLAVPPCRRGSRSGLLSGAAEQVSG